jgi:hypothetical protein
MILHAEGYYEVRKGPISSFHAVNIRANHGIGNYF